MQKINTTESLQLVLMVILMLSIFHVIILLQSGRQQNEKLKNEFFR